MFANGQTVIQWIEKLAPKHLAVPDDKIGLQLGTLNKDIKNILVALDVTEEVVDEAIQADANLIVAHHAIIFRPLKHLQTDTPDGKLVEKLIKNDIAVYIAHTNLDIAEGGINDWMADALGLSDRSCLADVHMEQMKKLVVFVPESHHDQVLQAIFDAGAGWIGNYSHCSFNIEGFGTFLPGEGTNPFSGEIGRVAREKEIRIETVVPQSIQNKVVQAMIKAHPYEEVAYDVYPLDLKGRSYGLGRVGKLPEAVTLQAFVDQVKTAFDVPMVRVVGDVTRPVRKVAVLGGSGSRYIHHAIRAGADVLVTGDIDYHTAHDALAAGLSIVDPGHNIEKIMKTHVAELLQTHLTEGKYQTKVLASQVNTEPFVFV